MPNAKPILLIEVTEKQKQRYWKKVNKNDDPSVCWPWTGAIKTKNGKPSYGHIRINKLLFGSNRIGWFIVHAHDPYPLHVLHSCDNALCCNPSHWFLGTNRDNILDKSRKGRNGRKLTVEKVRLIRAMLANNMPYKRIASTFGVGYSVVGAIKRGEVWSHVN